MIVFTTWKASKYGPKKTSYLDISHADELLTLQNSSRIIRLFNNIPRFYFIHKFSKISFFPFYKYLMEQARYICT